MVMKINHFQYLYRCKQHSLKCTSSTVNVKHGFHNSPLKHYALKTRVETTSVCPTETFVEFKKNIT